MEVHWQLFNADQLLLERVLQVSCHALERHPNRYAQADRVGGSDADVLLAEADLVRVVRVLH